MFASAVDGSFSRVFDRQGSGHRSGQLQRAVNFRQLGGGYGNAYGGYTWAELLHSFSSLLTWGVPAIQKDGETISGCPSKRPPTVQNRFVCGQVGDGLLGVERRVWCGSRRVRWPFTRPGINLTALVGWEESQTPSSRTPDC